MQAKNEIRTIVVLLSGVIGADNQSQALANALSRKWPSSTQEHILIHGHVGMPWALLTPALHIACSAWSRADTPLGISPSLRTSLLDIPATADVLIIGCSRKVAPVTAIAKRLRPKAFTVQIQHPRCDTSVFDLVTTPQHDLCHSQAAAANIIATNGSLHQVRNIISDVYQTPPNELPYRWAQAHGVRFEAELHSQFDGDDDGGNTGGNTVSSGGDVPFRMRDTTRHRRFIAVLIGGQSRHCKWDSSVMVEELRSLVNAVRMCNGAVSTQHPSMKSTDPSRHSVGLRDVTTGTAGHAGLGIDYADLLPCEQTNDTNVIHADDPCIVVTCSRRTPYAVLSAIAALQMEVPPGTLWLWNGSGANPLPCMFAFASAFAVSSDSVNMCSEAVATGKPVYSMCRRFCSGKLSRFHSRYEQLGCLKPWVVSVGEAFNFEHTPPTTTTCAVPDDISFVVNAIVETLSAVSM